MKVLGSREVYIALGAIFVCCGVKIHNYVSFVIDRHKWNNHLTELAEQKDSDEKKSKGDYSNQLSQFIKPL